jgi:uncharacterized repeat protein (TIGR01451 family)
MKSHKLRSYLRLSCGLLLILGLLAWGAEESHPAAAYSPPQARLADPIDMWDVEEIFICGDGSEQFIELRNPTSANQGTEFEEEDLIATNLAGTQTHIFTFPSDVAPPTGNKSVLIATSGFSSLPGSVTPDFILPDNFLFPGGGMVRLAVYDSVSYGTGQLPLDGLHSLNRQGGNLTSATNSPRNYAGQAGSVSCPPPAPHLTLVKTVDAAGIVEAGAVLSYTIRVANSGSAVATNALITDAVPISTTYVPNSASDGGIFSSGIIS